ncbi:hypothetical protein C0Z16_09425 [Paraburkholderia rhynchosiae]|uniref:Uncharacterized protein n=1 Tax=Paraburkholderia rhynchosiae TaxID=487049 RepID=A0ABX4V9G1_9BURK|nr:hypothetical protein C0Z16_09425 [Paraburkholderia rhynchosiae]
MHRAKAFAQRLRRLLFPLQHLNVVRARSGIDASRIYRAPRRSQAAARRKAPIVVTCRQTAVEKASHRRAYRSGR